MRVLALTNLYPNPWQPQRATFNRLQFRMMGQNHCSVHIIAPIAWPDEFRARRSGKLALPLSRRVELDGLKVDHPRVYHIPGMLRSYYGRFFYWSVRRTFRRVLEEFEPTIVYAPWVYPDGWAAIRLAREAGLPVVLQALGSDVLLMDQNPGRRAGTVEALRSADGIVAVSQNLADRMMGLGTNPERIRVVYNGLERQLFHPGPKADARQAIEMSGPGPHLLFVGNLVPVKGIDVLLKACSKLRTDGRDFRLHMVGEGPLRQPLANLSRTLEIADRVQWHGSIPQIQLPNWYRAADLLVLPSRSEGVPNVLLEASGCNTPWVATRVGGIPEIQHLGVNRIVAPESADELANAIAMMLLSPSKFGQVPHLPEEAVQQTSEFLQEIEDAVERGRKPAMLCNH